MGITCLRWILLPLTCMLVLATGCATSPTSVSVAPDNKQIRYTGRVAVSKEAALYDWANTQIEFKTTAPQVELLIKDGKNDYNLFIDGKFERIISTVDGNTVYPLDLADGAHLVNAKIMMRSFTDTCTKV